MLGIKNIVPSLLLLICLGAFGCGGSGHSSGGAEPEPELISAPLPDPLEPAIVPSPIPTIVPSPLPVEDTILQGTVAKGIVKNGIVEVFKIVEGAISDSVFLSGFTNALGSYSFTLEDMDYGPMLIKISAGNESDIASASIMICDIKPGCGETSSFGDEVTLTSDFSLAAIIPAITKRTITIANVTMLTDLAVEQARNISALDVEGLDVEGLNAERIDEANSYVGAMFGFTGNIVTLAVADITDSAAIAPLDLEAKKNVLVSAALLGVMLERVLPASVDKVSVSETEEDSEISIEGEKTADEEKLLPITIARHLQDLRDFFNTKKGNLANRLQDLNQPSVFDVLQKAMKIGQRIDNALPFESAIEALAEFQSSLDTDGDGVFDVNDFAPLDWTRRFDSDGDGVANLDDTFPEDYTEWADTDNDGVGNNRDAFPEDKRYQVDSDGDGWADEIDAFPNNQFEWKDSDGDKVGNNADPFPYDRTEWLDTDGDGRGDKFDDRFPDDPTEWADSDLDGVGDNSDAFPYDLFESKDSDGDGFGDRLGDDFPYDPQRVLDTDGDGYADKEDAFPYDSREWLDGDGDGYGDNRADKFPDDSTEWADTDRDDVGDNSDPCPLLKGDLCPISYFPVAINQTVDVIQGTTIAITMEASDLDDEWLLFVVSKEPELGSLLYASEYGPEQKYSTSETEGCGYSETFEFIANDGKTNSAPGIVTINVVCIKDLALGENHSCALVDPVAGEAILCWGDDRQAQTTISEQIDSNISNLVAGDNHSCALTQSGTYCWGDNTYGQAGDHTYTELLSMSAGSKHSCVLDANAVIQCWGDNTYEQLQTPNVNPVTSLDSAGDFTCALYSPEGGSTAVSCWGSNDYGQQNVPALNNPTMIAAGTSHICAIDTDGVSCWGGSETSLTTPAEITSPTAIVAGTDFSCVIDESPVVSSEASTGEVTSEEEATVEQSDAEVNSTVVCWGVAGSEVVDNVPEVKNPTMLKAGTSFACVIDDSGLKCWGNNVRGQLAPNPSNY